MNFTNMKPTIFTENVCSFEETNLYQCSNKNVCLVEDEYFEKYNKRDNLIIFYFINLVIYYITVVITLVYIFKLFNKYIFQAYLAEVTKNMYQDFNIHYQDDEYIDNERTIIENQIIDKNYIKKKYGSCEVVMKINKSETKVYLQDKNNNFNLIFTKNIGTHTLGNDEIVPEWCTTSKEYFKCRLEKLLEDTRIAIPLDSFCAIGGNFHFQSESFIELDKHTKTNELLINMLKNICCKRGWENKFVITHLFKEV